MRKAPKVEVIELAKKCGIRLKRPRPIPRKNRPRCGAKTRRGTPCQCQAMKNGRCKYHGGMSTGPRTKEGRQRISEAQKRRWQRHKEMQAELETRVES